MRKICDWCKKPVKKVGKLFKADYLMLCKDCRKKYKAKKSKRKGKLVGRIMSIKRIFKFKR